MIKLILLIIVIIINYCEAQEKSLEIEKYKTWKDIINKPKQSEKVFKFFYDNPHWPLFKQSIKIAETNISKRKKLNKDNIYKWFQRYPPTTKEGIDAYIECLKSKNRKLTDKYIKQTWVFQNLNIKYAKQFRKQYTKYLTVIEDAQRAKRLATQNDTEQLLAMKDMIPKDSSNIKDYINETLKKNIKFDQSLILDSSKRYKYIEQLINNKQYKEAAKILVLTNNGENNVFLSNKYFEKRRYIAYSMLRSGEPRIAYVVADKCILSSHFKSEDIAKLQWLLGFIAYRFTNQIKLAKEHFEKAYKNSKKSIRLSKNAFWLGEVYLSQKDVVAATDWYKKAAQYFSTFYGYLADQRLKYISGIYMSPIGLSLEFNTTIHIPAEIERVFHNRELVQILESTKNYEKDSKYRKYFYDQLIDEIDDPYEEILLMELAQSNDEIDTLIEKINKKQHYFSNKKIYKQLKDSELIPIRNINSNTCFVSMVHSVIKQESAFNSKARSYVGAIGLMQLMPKTAEDEAKRLNIKYNKKDLYNKYNNLILGSNLLNRLMKKYNYNLVNVLYAYNAGEGNLKKYQNSIKNLKNLTVLETIELIPIKETRMYIKSVLRNRFYYDKQFDCQYKDKVIETTLKNNNIIQSQT